VKRSCRAFILYPTERSSAKAMLLQTKESVSKLKQSYKHATAWPIFHCNGLTNQFSYTALLAIHWAIVYALYMKNVKLNFGHDWGHHAFLLNPSIQTITVLNHLSCYVVHEDVATRLFVGYFTTTSVTRLYSVQR
jgi:hypothetical protein